MFACVALSTRAEDGYRLWLRYDPIGDGALRQSYRRAAATITLTVSSATESPTIAVAREELGTGLLGLLGTKPTVHMSAGKPNPVLGEEGYAIRATPSGIEIAANRDVGTLYGAFALLRHFQTHQPIEALREIVATPRIQRRLLNHWDNLNRTVERGQAGQSIWEWFSLPDYVSPRYRDYARANASIGINGAVLTNVNADALVLTPAYLQKVRAIANVLRPYGIRVYLTARFSAPREIGRLKTVDPVEPDVAAWWRAKADEIHALIPDFGGFLVKANSEGQPGPQNYQRSHAEGANTIADALAPHGGIVLWRAFVYDSKVPEDRAKQAFTEFQPLDGQFRDNVVVQIKNGPIDFMPREPFHPLFGAMPRTPLALELQIAQEYLGGAVHLAYLAPMWQECLDSDTFRPRPGATVARVIDGTLLEHGPAPAHRVTPRSAAASDLRTALSVIAGVANIGTDRNWTGNPLAQANWYAFGRLAWDHTIRAEAIAEEWTRLTFSNSASVVRPVTAMLLASREAVVSYSMPLGLHHIMAEGHHYGPGPWVARSARADWNSTYYHRADENGIGFDRTASGSNALSQYAPDAAARWADLTTCPAEFLLWFHHVPWDHRMQSGRILWEELCLRYQRGVDAVREGRKTWAALEHAIDAERFAHVRALLGRQEREAREWRDACTQYFQTFAKRPLPAGVEPPEHPLEFYQAVQRRYVPGNPSGR
jgi:alpha-glucuronidase